MKLCVVVLFYLMILSTTANAQKYTGKKKLKTPPGTVKINDSLYFDKYEINNLAWREMIAYINQIEKGGIKTSLLNPDSTVWKDSIISDYYIPFEQAYSHHPSFNNYPVVGITYEQAGAYCEWRSKVVNERFTLKSHVNKKMKYRLPTIEEWEYAAAGKLNLEQYPLGYEKTMYKKYYKIGNVIYDNKNRNIVVYTSTVDGFYPNKYGIKNMIGNVSEMTATKGISKGGNFTLTLEESKIKNKQHYTKPEVWLGFRCVCEIVNE